MGAAAPVKAGIKMDALAIHCRHCGEAISLAGATFPESGSPDEVLAECARVSALNHTCTKEPKE